VVTSLTVERWAAQDLHEKFYFAMGEMETRIKDADVPVRRPALYRRNERQPVASLLLRLGLHPCGSAAAVGTEGTAWAETLEDTIRRIPGKRRSAGLCRIAMSGTFRQEPTATVISARTVPFAPAKASRSLSANIPAAASTPRQRSSEIGVRRTIGNRLQIAPLSN
jgi:hypothetical protein